VERVRDDKQKRYREITISFLKNKPTLRSYEVSPADIEGFVDREDLANIEDLMDIEEDLASIVPVVGIVDTEGLEGLPDWVDTELVVETEDHPSSPPVDATYSTPDKWAIQQRQGCTA